MKTRLFILLLSTLSASPALARIEMLIVDRATPTNTITVGSNEVVSVRKHYEPGSVETGFLIRIGNHTTLSGCNQCPALALPIKGPTTISLVVRDPAAVSESWVAYALLEITPESFPPDKTIVIPEGGGANIGLECSTNLIDWTAAPLGVYTNQPTVKFFRLRAERLP